MSRIVGIESVASQEPKPFTPSKSSPYPRQEYSGPIAPPNSGLVGAALCGTLDGVRAAVEADRASLNSVGPEGLTALQAAIRNGRTDVAKLLIELGADVDARGAKNRTAILVACQIGSLSPVHMLLENNCDMEVVDDDGRGCMHYAAVSPSPIIIHYLQYVADQTLLCLDNQKATPLHIAARHPRFTETLDYLVAQNVYSILDRDKTGSTPLHYAAQAGNRANCFRLMCAMGDKRGDLMRIEDRNGHTALFLVQRAKRHWSRTLAVELTTWNKMGIYHAWFHWLLHFSFTPISMTVMLLSMAYLPDYFAFFIAFLAPLLFFRAFKDLTRVDHVSRWPSPLMLGTFLSGVVHSLVCFAVRINPVMMEHNGISLTTIFHWMVAVLVTVNVWRILRQDPGICHDPSLKKDGTPYDVEDVAADMCTDDVSRLKFCSRCSMVPPPVTKHCRLCDNCVENFDHHCVWLNRCVGYLNMRLFVLLVMTLVLTNATFFFGAWQYLIYKNHPMRNFPDVFQVVSNKEPWVCWLMAMNALCFSIALKMVMEKLVVVSNGCTAYFDQHGQRYTGYGSLLDDLTHAKKHSGHALSRREKLTNILSFLATSPQRRVRKPIIST